MTRAGRIALVCAALLLGATAVAAAPPDRERVLVLSSFQAGDPFIEPVIDGIRDALSARQGLSLSVEYVDAEHASDGPHLDHFRALLAAKYADLDVDTIITLDDPALRLALDMRDRIAAGVPVIFGEINGVSPEQAAALANASGVLGGYDMERTLQLMAELHPDRDQILVVDDNSPRGVWLRRDFARARARFSDRFTFRDSAGATVAALERELAELGPDHLVFYLSFMQDAAGVRLGFHDGLGRIARAANVPVYGAMEGMAGFGIVGGYVQSSTQLGRTLGRQVIDVLDGKDLAAIPVIERAPHRYVFDFRQLRRFGISPGALPSGALVIETPDTLYYRYRQYVWMAVAAFLAMAFYIAQLLTSIRKRDRARRGLERLAEAGKRPLSVDQPTALLDDIVGRLKAIAPDLTPLGFYRYAALPNPSDIGLLVPCSEKFAGPPRPEPDLVRRAFKTGRNQFDGHQALLVLDNDKLPADVAHFHAGHRLDAFDQRLVDLFTRNIAIECDNIEALRLSSSLKAARQIQDAMLPKDFDQTAHAYDVDLHALLRPARQVGGDLYDFFPLDDDRLCLLVGDVSGKGVPAALFMATTKTLVRAAAETQPDPGAILEKVNAALCHNNCQMMFVTLFCAIYTRGSGRIAYANAGHTPPLMRTPDGRVAAVAVDTNIALGLLERAAFPTQTTTLPAGATLLLFTDGVTEAMNGSGQPFQEARLKTVLASRGAARAQQLTAATLSAVGAFTGQTPQSDDLTVLCLRRDQADRPVMHEPLKLTHPIVTPTVTGAR